MKTPSVEFIMEQAHVAHVPGGKVLVVVIQLDGEVKEEKANAFCLQNR